MPSRLQAWSTPAFLKRDRLSGNSYFGSDYDPFDEDEFRDNSRRKKTKYGRASNQWRFTEQESSPESAFGSKSPPTEPLAVNGAQNEAVKDRSQNVDLQAMGDNRTESYEQPAENPVTSHGPLVDAGVQVDDYLTSQLAAETRPQATPSSPVIPSQSQTLAPEHHYPHIVTTEAEMVKSSESVDIPMDTITLVNPAIPLTSLDNGSPDPGAYSVENDGAVSFPQLSHGIPRAAPPGDSSQGNQRNLVRMNEATEDHKSAESQELLQSQAGEDDSLPWIPRKSREESVSDRPSQDARSPSPVLKNSGLREIRDGPKSAVQMTMPQEPRFSTPNLAQDDFEIKSAITETEGPQELVSPPQEPSPKLLDQADQVAHGMTPESSQAVPESYMTEDHTVTIVKSTQSRSRSPTRFNVNMVSSDQDAGLILEQHLEGSSQPHDSRSEQLVTASAQSPQDDIDLEDDKAQQETVVEPDPEEDAQAQSPSPDMPDLSDSEGEEFSEEDVIIDDETRKNQAKRSHGDHFLFKSEAEDYYANDVPNAEVSDDEQEELQEDETKEMTAPQRTSAVQIIALDDSDEDDADVARSQTDGATMSILHATRQQSHAIGSLLPKQKGGSPIHSSPSPLPDTIPDSQAAAEVGNPGSDVESATAEDKEVNASSPSLSRSVSNSYFREDSEGFDDGEEIEARLQTASLSSEIPLETYIDPRLKNKVLTPNDTQARGEFSQTSHISSQRLPKSHDLPTPQLTQNRSSDVLLPAALRPSSPSARSSSPTAPAAESSPPSHNEVSAPDNQNFISELRKVKDAGSALTAAKTSSRSRRVSNIPPSLSAWFAPRRSNEVVPDSLNQSPEESEESDVSSSKEIADIEDIEEVGGEQEQQEEEEEEEEEEETEEEEEEIPSANIKPHYKPPPFKPVFQRTSPAASLHTSTPPTGLRTSHAYYTPLSNLPSHFNTATSTLSIVLASLPIARATSGPRDFHTTLFLTDPSSIQEQKAASQSSNSFHASNLSTSAFTLTRLFRPSRISLPQTPKKGDVILLRSCAVTSYARTASLLSSNSSAWALFSHQHHTEPAIAGPPVEFGAEERGYVRGLWEWWEQLEEHTKEGVMEAVADQVKKLEAKAEREKMKGRRLKGMGLRLAPGMGRETENPRHELRDGKEWSDEVGRSTTSPRTPRRSRGVRHELRDGKGWVDGESPRTSRGRS